MNKKVSLKMLFTPDVKRLSEPNIAGTERMFLKDLFNAKKNFKVQAFARFRYQSIRQINVPKVFLELRLFFDKRPKNFLFQAGSIFCQLLIDSYYCLEFTKSLQKDDLILAYSFPFIGMLFPKRTIVFMHYHPHFLFPKLLKRRYEKIQFVFCSSYLKSEIEQGYPYIAFQSTVLYNSVDTTVFKPAKTKKTTNVIRLLFASAWSKEKGLEALVDAMNQLSPSMKKRFDLTIASSPFLWSEEDQQKQVQFSQKIYKKIKANVHISLLNGVSSKDMPQLYQQHDFVVFPSFWNEPFGLVALESLACGTPLIATQTGGIPELTSSSNTTFIKTTNTQGILEALVSAKNIWMRKRSSNAYVKRLFTAKNTVMCDSTRANLFLKLIQKHQASLRKFV